MKNTQNNIVAPTVNLNGSSREGLLENHIKAMLAIGQAMNALVRTAPHPRDFQTTSAGEYDVARAQALARHHALDGVLKELNIIVEMIADQGPQIIV